MLGPQRVAWLALAYRACHLNGHNSPESVFGDFESCPGEVSLATLDAGVRFGAADWKLVALLDRPELVLPAARVLTERDELARAEALMHSLPPRGRRSRKSWALPYAGRRWSEVEQVMRAFEAEGFSMSRDEVESLAVRAYTVGTGKTHSDYMDEYANTLFPEDIRV
jgi:hypothetical protein